MTCSVLMSTYYKENAEYLDIAFDSIWTSQTRKPEEIVLVEDGPLTAELCSVIEKWKGQLASSLVIVEKQHNEGLAKALNSGLAVAKGDIIIRMDSDDIAYPERISEEMEYLEQHHDIDVVGAWISEFIDNKENVVSVRKVPETAEEIYHFGKKRNPMNHPTVAFRRERIVNHGGYTHYLLFEDYYLWASLLLDGYKFHNIQKPLLWFRTSADMYARRGGLKYALTEISFQRYLHKIGYISTIELIKNTCMRFLGRVMPNSMRKHLYSSVMR